MRRFLIPSSRAVESRFHPDAGKGLPGGPTGRAGFLRLAALAVALVSSPLPLSGQAASGDAPAPSIPPADTSSLQDGSGPGLAGDLTRGVAVAAALLATDEVLRRKAETWQGETADGVAETAKWLGNWKEVAPLYLAGLATVGWLADGTEGLGAAGAIALGTFAGAMVNTTGNRLVGRDRPQEERGSLAFSPFRGRHASFPSGHAAFTFAMAAAIDEATEGPLPAGVAYAVAGMCGVSRIYHDRHWASDVVIGAAVGVLVSRKVTRAALQRMGLRESTRSDGSPGGTPPGFTAEPYAGPGVVGISLRF